MPKEREKKKKKGRTGKSKLFDRSDQRCITILGFRRWRLEEKLVMNSTFVLLVSVLPTAAVAQVLPLSQVDRCEQQHGFDLAFASAAFSVAYIQIHASHRLYSIDCEQLEFQ